MPEPTATKPARHETGIKDTIESILVAFILAFVFRAFVVEAFVIPTGSMAPTLYGAHMRYHCPDCGYTFDAGFRATPNSTDGDDLDIPSDPVNPTIDYHCPNCGYEMSKNNKEPVRFGDRILVLKYLYLFQKPKQWDVVVFKSPDEQQSKHVAEDPEYGMNYIKRLIANGPASVVILDGDVYIAPAYVVKTVSETGTTVTVTTAEPHNFNKGQSIAVSGVGMAAGDAAAAKYNGTVTVASVINPTTFTYTADAGLAASGGGVVSAATAPPWTGNQSPFKIQRKPRYAQDALWRVIYHNDFVPHIGASGASVQRTWTQPWQEETPATGWTLGGPPNADWPVKSPSRIFDFANDKGGGTIAFHSDANPRPGPAEGPNAGQSVDALSDFLVYDESEHRDYRNHNWQPVYVSDLKLSCNYTRRSGDGPLRLQLSKKADLFTAEFTPGKVRLLRAQRVQSNPAQTINETELRAVSVKALAGTEAVRVELINVDYRVSIRVNGEEVIATTDAEYYPKIQELWDQEERAARRGSGAPDQGLVEFAKPIVRIDAQRQNARLEHIILSRDIYYLSSGRFDTTFWSTVQNIMHLNDGEYFVMGDNSFISGDARYWSTRIDLPREGLEVESGRVPERFMLGKAFFVYWPAGYRFPLLPGNVNAVPDFGEMRFIR